MNDTNYYRICIILFLLLPAALVFSEPEQKEEVNPAELVRKVRSQEDWLHEFKTLYIYAERKWITSPEELQKRAEEIKSKHKIENPDPNQFSELMPTKEAYVEFAMDQHRVRYFQNDPTYWFVEKIWDGKEFRCWEKYYNHPQNNYI